MKDRKKVYLVGGDGEKLLGVVATAAGGPSTTAATATSTETSGATVAPAATARAATEHSAGATAAAPTTAATGDLRTLLINNLHNPLLGKLHLNRRKFRRFIYSGTY
jgi:hydroxyethylthiazole kinase-like sugar kinase family protein